MVLLLAIACSPITACKKEPAARAKARANAEEFWPEAPTPTIKTGTRTFHYQPQNMGRYKLVADGGSTESTLPMKVKMILELDFRAGHEASDRNVHIEVLDMWATAGRMRMEMRINSQEFFFKQGQDETRIRRGENAAFDVAALTEEPLTIVSFDAATNAVRMRANPEHPFAELDSGAADLMGSGFLLFPDLPQGPVSPGYHWSVTRDTAIGTTKKRIEIAYDFQYVGDGACPSGTGTCSLLSFTAATPGIDDLDDEGEKMHLVYGFAGKVFFNHDRGTIDESRVRADMDVTAKNLATPIGITYVVEPRT